MLTFFATSCVLISASGALPGPEVPISVSVPAFTLVGEFDRARADAFSDFLAQRLERTGAWKVVTANQVAQVLGMERQKQLLGCSGDGACMTEIAAALGTETLLSGNLGRVGSAYTVNLRLLNTKDGATVSSASERLPSEDALYEWVEAVASAFTHSARQSLRSTAGLTAAARRTPNRAPGVALVVGGGVVAATGGLLRLLAQVDADRLQSRTSPLLDQLERDAVAARGSALQASGFVAIGFGVTAVLVGVVLLAAGVPLDTAGASATPERALPSFATLTW